MKAEALDQADRCVIARLNVGFETMQAQAPEREPQDRGQSLTHVALPCKRRPDVVAEVGAAEVATDDLADFEGAEDRLILAAYDEPAFALRVAQAEQQLSKRRAGARRRDQPGVEPPAAVVEREVLGGVAGAWRAQLDPAPPYCDGCHVRASRALYTVRTEENESTPAHERVPLTGRAHAAPDERDVTDRTHLHAARARPGEFAGDLHRFIHVLGLDQIEAS